MERTASETSLGQLKFIGKADQPGQMGIQEPESSRNYDVAKKVKKAL